MSSFIGQFSAAKTNMQLDGLVLREVHLRFQIDKVRAMNHHVVVAVVAQWPHVLHFDSYRHVIDAGDVPVQVRSNHRVLDHTLPVAVPVDF